MRTRTVPLFDNYRRFHILYAPMFIYETHAHTAETSPCGKVRAHDMVSQYHHAGYHGIVITDHYFNGFFMNPLNGLSQRTKIDNYLKGYRRAREEGAKHDMDIMLGLELRFDSDPNDYLVYGVTEEHLYAYPRLNEMTLSSFYTFSRGTTMRIFQAHPFRAGITRADPSLLDGMEAFNGNPRQNSFNEEAARYAAEHSLVRISGSDFHQYEDCARGGMSFPERVRDSVSFAHALPTGTCILPKI
ncbi:MAG: PHP domain-containing protein [Spirochaetota bacterium]